jgi:predicted RNA binding protein YcfA (HicA-like mRNA interferase family)
MGKLGNIGGAEAVKAFRRLGWRVAGQVGSHVVLVKPGIRVNLSVPQHRELSVGTLRALIRNAGISVDEFIESVR